jgi:hypothetical protein
MKVSRSFLTVALAGLFSLSLLAQTAPSGYHSVACIKVKPENTSEFRKWVAGDVHKFTQSRADSGAISTWYLLRAVIPQGTSADCDYLVVSMYPGVPPKPLDLTEMSAALKKAGLTATAQEYIDKRNSLTTLVSNEIFQNQAFVGMAKKGDYFQVNYMKVPDMEDFVAYEKKVWKPLAEAMAKDGVRTGWSLNTRVMPTGSETRFQAVTVDVFPTWEAMFTEVSFADTFKKVHPDMEIGTTFEHYEKLRTILMSNTYQLEDVISSAK